MSSFDDDFAAAGVPPLLEEFADAVTYRALDGTELSLSGMFAAAETRESPDEDGREQQITRSLTVSTDAATWGALGGPTPRAVIVDPAGLLWSVESLEHHSASLTTLKLVQIAPTELTRPGYRR